MSDTTPLLNKPNIERVCADLRDKQSLSEVLRGVDGPVVVNEIAAP